MTDGIDISVVVPVYNGQDLLAGCLTSIALAVEELGVDQRSRTEVIVCDNHSTDGSREIAEKSHFGCASRVVQPPNHEENRTKNWSYGLSQARGRWLMMLHHDDLMTTGGLVSQMLHAARTDIDYVVMIAGRHRTFRDPQAPGRSRPVVAPEGIMSGRLVQRRILPFHCPFEPFVLFRRAAYEAIGGFHSQWELVQDWELWMRLLGKGDVLQHGEDIAWWREHPTSSNYRYLNAREHVEIVRELEKLIPSISPRAQARAETVALDRAALQLVDMEEPDLAWLAPDHLPDPAIAKARHRRTLRRVALELATLRMTGAIRSRARSVVQMKSA